MRRTHFSMGPNSLTCTAALCQQPSGRGQPSGLHWWAEGSRPCTPGGSFSPFPAPHSLGTYWGSAQCLSGKKRVPQSDFWVQSAGHSTEPKRQGAALPAISFHTESRALTGGALLPWKVCHRKLCQSDPRLARGTLDRSRHSEEQEDDSGYAGRWVPGNQYGGVPQSQRI
uniref:Aconitate decarboxylase 1 n=1 Tax=Molossus molossus TaxID=27622 RepID=A0A7J8GIJ4_MOLMO|nr:aconitate decarboxylase 1 [Molossus molossus]